MADTLHSPIRLKRAPNCYSTPKRAKKCSNSSKSPSNQSPIAPKSHSPSAVSPSDDIIQSYVIGIADKLKEQLKNKDDFEKFLRGNPKGKKKIIDNQVSIQVHTNKSKNKRKYDKPHICFYCGACIIKLSRHFFLFHSNESEVLRIGKMQKGSKERSFALTLLNQKGDFLHNAAVLSSNQGCLFVLRRPDAGKPIPISQYIPCIYCLGYLTVDQMYRHSKKCKYKQTSQFGTIKTKNLTKQGRFLIDRVIACDKSSALWQSAAGELMNDEVGMFVKNDKTLYSLGNTLILNKGYEQRRYIRDKLRVIGRFCVKYHKEYATEDRSVKEIFQTKNFSNCLSLAQTYRGDALTPAIKLGQYLKDVLVIFKQDAIFERDTDRIAEYDNLKFLLESKWSQEINSPHNRMLKEKKAKVVEMPITGDITKFLKYLDGEIFMLGKEIRQNGLQNGSQELWIKLAKSCLGYLIVFNRRREGEVSKLELKTYTDRPEYQMCESDVLRKTMTTAENILSDTYSYMTTRGKTNRQVAIVYATQIKEALDILVKYRECCGIHPDNFFLFANSCTGHLRGHVVLNELVENCRQKYVLEKPKLIKSTKLRKHVATVAQVMCLNPGEIGNLSNHMGHSESVHKEFYRQTESVIETTQMVKLLQLVNNGKITRYKGKTLKDVAIEDIITAVTNEANELKDDDDDVDDDFDDVDNERVDEPSSSTSNLSLDVELLEHVVEPSPSTSTQSNTKLSRQAWPAHIKVLAKIEFKDVIDKKVPLNSVLANAFLNKHNLMARGLFKFKNMLYNMGRSPRN